MKATPNPLLTYEEIMKAYPKSRIWSLIALCKKGTTECVNSILRVIDSLVSTLSSLIESFKTDKSAVPHPDLRRQTHDMYLYANLFLSFSPLIYIK